MRRMVQIAMLQLVRGLIHSQMIVISRVLTDTKSANLRWVRVLSDYGDHNFNTYRFVNNSLRVWLHFSHSMTIQTAWPASRK